MTQAVAYIRVSTLEQASPDRTSLAQQRERCEAYAKAQDWELVEVYEDAGISGATDVGDRPALSKLLQDAAAKKFERVIFLKIDRLARDLRGLLNLSFALKKLNIGLVSVTEQFDTATTGGKMYFNLLGTFAEFERDMIAERMSIGRKGRVANGAYIASVIPWGYARVDGHLEICEAEAATIRRIYSMAISGMGLHAISTALNDEGVIVSRRPGKHGILPASIAKLISSPRYCGRASYAGEPMACPALVSPATYDAARKAMAQRKSESLRNTRHAYALQGRVVCGHCGSKYLSKTVPQGQLLLCRERATYGRDAGHNDVKWRWKATEIEDRVKDMIRQFVSDPDQAAKMITVYAEQVEQAASSIDSEALTFMARQSDLCGQRDRVLDWGRRGVLDEKDMRKQLTAIKAEQADVAAKLRKLDESSAKLNAKEVLTTVAQGWQEMAEAVTTLKQQAVAKGHDLRIEWNEWDDEQWKRAIAYFVDRVVVNDDGSLTVEGVLTAGAPVKQPHRRPRTAERR